VVQKFGSTFSKGGKKKVKPKNMGLAPPYHFSKSGAKLWLHLTTFQKVVQNFGSTFSKGGN